MPQEIRHAALAVGATKWQATQHHVLPYALPGVVTGVIIGISRAIGETAPLILIGGLTFVAFLPITRPGDATFEIIGALDEYGAPVTPEAVESVRIDHDGVVVFPDFTELPVLAGQTYELPHGSTVQWVATLGDAAASWPPTNWLQSEFTVMPIQMFNWTSRPQAEFLEIAAAAGLVLLAMWQENRTIEIFDEIDQRLRMLIRTVRQGRSERRAEAGKTGAGGHFQHSARTQE